MEVRVLGCDGSYPAANGACSGYLVTFEGGQRFLLDCGTAVLPRLMSLMDPSTLSAVIITHWHNDHASDMLTLRYYLQIHRKQLRVYAPATDQALRTLCVGDEFDLRDIKTGFEMDDIRMLALSVQHPVPAYAVRLSDKSDRSMVYTGDIAEGSSAVSFCKDADLLICDASFTDEQWHPMMPHLSARMAGELGNLAGVKQLLLTHCQPNNDVNTLLAQGREAYPGAQFAKAGMLIKL